MNYKIILNILFYIILYHVVFECLEFYFYNLKIYTPLGHIYRKYILHQELSNLNNKDDLFIFLFNVLISIVLLGFGNKWYGKENVIITFFKLLGIFVFINFLLGIYVIIKYDLSTSFVYVFYFLIPMSVMFLLMLPMFWINDKILKL